MAAIEADILVIFGITGDLAKKMTFEALYRLERRGDLTCRKIIGIARNKWSEDELEGHARESIEAHVPDPDQEAVKRLDGAPRLRPGRVRRSGPLQANRR